MGKVWDLILYDVSLLAIVLNSTYLILNSVSFLAFVALLRFESLLSLNRLSLHLRRHWPGLLLRLCLLLI